MSMSVGIDLGTYNSCVAVYRNGKVDVIENNRGERFTPTCVTFMEHEILIGADSMEKLYQWPHKTVVEAKRLIGQRFDDPKVQADIKRFPYTIFNDRGTPKIKIDEKEYYPEEVSGCILRSLKSFAESRLANEITRAVITVPAYFNEAQRHATKAAGRIAGFQNISLINEPTAAVMAFVHQNEKTYKRYILVYDFRRGTFDVSVIVVEKNNKHYWVMATNGDCHLGGINIDENLTEFFESRKEYNTRLKCDLMTNRRLKNICERVKMKLSTQYHVELDLDYLPENIPFVSFNLSRARFEQINEELFKRTIRFLDECLRNCGLLKDDIDEVILVGGSSKILKVKDMLKDYFGKDKVSKGINPEEAIVYGAAIHAFNLATKENEDEDFLPLETDTYEDQAEVLASHPISHTNQITTECPTYQGETVGTEELQKLIQTLDQKQIQLKEVALKNYTFWKSELKAMEEQSRRLRECFDQWSLLNLSAGTVRNNSTIEFEEIATQSEDTVTCTLQQTNECQQYATTKNRIGDKEEACDVENSLNSFEATADLPETKKCEPTLTKTKKLMGDKEEVI